MLFLIKRKLDYMAVFNALFMKIFHKKVKQEIRLAETAYASDNLDSTVSLHINQKLHGFTARNDQHITPSNDGFHRSSLKFGFTCIVSDFIQLSKLK